MWHPWVSGRVDGVDLRPPAGDDRPPRPPPGPPVDAADMFDGPEFHFYDTARGDGDGEAAGASGPDPPASASQPSAPSDPPRENAEHRGVADVVRRGSRRLWGWLTSRTSAGAPATSTPPPAPVLQPIDAVRLSLLLTASHCACSEHAPPSATSSRRHCCSGRRSFAAPVVDLPAVGLRSGADGHRVEPRLHQSQLPIGRHQRSALSAVGKASTSQSHSRARACPATAPPGTPLTLQTCQSTHPSTRSDIR
jgi:hypothetical protein